MLSNLTLLEYFLWVQIFMSWVYIFVINSCLNFFFSIKINYHYHLEFMYVSQLAFGAEMDCNVNYRVGFMKTTLHCSFLF